MIGDDISVEVVDIRVDKARLGVTAPKAIPVHRREIWKAIRKQKRESVGAGALEVAEGTYDLQRKGA